MRNVSLCSSIDFEREVISHWNNKRLLARSLLFLSAESTQIRPTRVFFLFLSYFSRNSDDQIDLKCSQVCYFMLMLGYTKWEYWYLTVTKHVRCLQTTCYRILYLGHKINPHEAKYCCPEVQFQMSYTLAHENIYPSMENGNQNDSLTVTILSLGRHGHFYKGEDSRPLKTRNKKRLNNSGIHCKGGAGTTWWGRPHW